MVRVEQTKAAFHCESDRLKRLSFLRSDSHQQHTQHNYDELKLKSELQEEAEEGK